MIDEFLVLITKWACKKNINDLELESILIKATNEIETKMIRGCTNGL